MMTSADRSGLKWLAMMAGLVHALVPLDVGAQAVQGTVVEAGSDHPVPGVWVMLAGAGGERVAARISDEHGRVLLSAPTPGWYTVRAERIGFRSVQLPPIQLEEGQTARARIEVPVEAIGLEGVVVRAERRCVGRPEDGRATAALWEEARKALDVLVHTERERIYRYHVHRYERSLDPVSLRVRHEQARGGSWFGAVPFQSLPAAELARDGFIQERQNGTFFYAPDAAVLLSEEFLDSYCFRALPAPPESPGLVGLAFEPARGVRVPAIQGALWLDERSAELRFAEFSYLRAPGPRDRRVGGRVEFDRLPSGAWMVRRWRIRMPEIVVRSVRAPSGATIARDEVGGLAESGAVVVAVEDGAGRRIDTTERATIRGLVREPATGAPLSGATVRLAGTVHTARTGDDGRFTIEGLFEGRWALTYSHPRLDAFGFRTDTVAVVLPPAGVVEFDLDAPSRQALVDAACPDTPDDQPERERGLMVGVIRDAETGQRLPGATVRAVWTRYTAVDLNRQIDSDLPESLATTGDTGHYRLCGLPVDHPFTLRIRPDGGDWRRPIPARIMAPDGVVERDLETRPQPEPPDPDGGAGRR